MYFGTANGAYSYNASTGTQNWAKLTGDSFSQVFNTNGNTFFGGNNGVKDVSDSNGNVRVDLIDNQSLGFAISLNGN
jgi:hypothetical protein